MPSQEQSSIPVVRFESSSSCPELFSFIQHINKVKILKVPEGFNKSPIRPAIMKVLRVGIEDKATKQKRYALNAREIKQELDTEKSLINALKQKKREEESTPQISYTNLYFHLNKLLEVGAIRTVVIAIERSHRIAYYGRTAHVILLRPQETGLPKCEKMNEVFNEFNKLMTILIPDIDVEKIEELPEQYCELINERELVIAQWVADHAHVIRENNLDLVKIFDALKIIDTLNPKYEKLFQKLTDILPNR